ncbi:MAG: T9SS type A sorting domain-containing protein [Bacteroidota bacterium]
MLPSGYGEWCAATDWFNLNGDCPHNGGFATPDYFHTMGEGLVGLPHTGLGTIHPRSGEAIMAIATWVESLIDFREYLFARLHEPLEVGSIYRVSFYYSNGESNLGYGGYGIDHLGVLFSMDTLVQAFAEPLPLTPQVASTELLYSNSWEKVTFQFLADSAYQYFTVGNFLDDEATNLQQIEDINIEAAYYYLDDFCISKLTSTCETTTSVSSLRPQFQWRVFPNPVEEQYWLQLQTELAGPYVFELFDALGRKQRRYFVTAGEHLLEREDLGAGVYFYRLVWAGQIVKSGQLLFH